MPATFNGQSFFEFEDLIDDWLGIRTFPSRRHGPSLKNGAIGPATFYKSMLDNDSDSRPLQRVQQRNDFNAVSMQQHLHCEYKRRRLPAAFAIQRPTFSRCTAGPPTLPGTTTKLIPEGVHALCAGLMHQWFEFVPR